MCRTANCCFNISPPNSPSPKIPPKPSRISCTDLVPQPSWKGRRATVAVAGFTYAMIGIGVIEGLSFSSSSAEGFATSGDGVVEQRERRVLSRWSNARTCPPWQSKKFELIVPERLPRPSPRRRWESVGNNFAPVVRANAGANNNGSRKCFSL